MERKTITDGEMYNAMIRCFNEDLNIDPTLVLAIEQIQEQEEPLKWNGATWNYNGMDIKNQKHPFFEK